MLVFTRQSGDTLNLTSNDQEITLKFLNIDDNQAKIGISASDEEKILRQQLLEKETECCF